MMENDLISRSELLDEIKSLRVSVSGRDVFPNTAKISVMMSIKEAPAVDAAPVVHGRWLNFYGDFSVAECSKCAETFEVSAEEETCKEFFEAFKYFYKYCPNCGAKMDRKE